MTRASMHIMAVAKRMSAYQKHASSTQATMLKFVKLSICIYFLGVENECFGVKHCFHELMLGQLRGYKNDKHSAHRCLWHCSYTKS